MPVTETMVRSIFDLDTMRITSDMGLGPTMAGSTPAQPAQTIQMATSSPLHFGCSPISQGLHAQTPQSLLLGVGAGLGIEGSVGADAEALCSTPQTGQLTAPPLFQTNLALQTNLAYAPMLPGSGPGLSFPPSPSTNGAAPLVFAASGPSASGIATTSAGCKRHGEDGPADDMER